MENKDSEPFGSTEWELRERLNSSFRLGKEFFVLAHKKLLEVLSKSFFRANPKKTIS